MEIGQVGRNIIGGILDKVSARKAEIGERIRLIGVSELASWLSREEWMYCEWLLNTNFPEDNELARDLRSEDLFNTLVPIRGQWYLGQAGFQSIETQFLPPHVYEAFEGLRRLLRRDLDVSLLLFSGFRSVAYQVYLFLYWLRAWDWNFQRVLRRIALPGYSEHNDARNTGIDVMTICGVPDPQGNGGPGLGFETTEEYRWLEKNARCHGFKFSFPKNNNKGKDFEPWHLQFLGG